MSQRHESKSHLPNTQERGLNRVTPKRVDHRLMYAACDERQKHGTAVCLRLESLDGGHTASSAVERAAKERSVRPRHASKTLTARASTQRCRKSALVFTGGLYG